MSSQVQPSAKTMAATADDGSGDANQAPAGTSGRGTPSSPSAWLTRAGMVLVAIAFLVPFYWLLVSALRPAERIFADAGTFLPDTLTLANFVALWQDAPIARWFLNSFILAAGSTIGSLILVTMAAYPLARMNFRGRNAIFVGILASQMLPFQLLLIPLFLLMITFNLIDTHLGVILPLIAHPFGLFYMRQYMLGLPQEVFDAARVDGASEFAIFRRIVVPMVKPALGTLAVLFSLEQWNELLWPLVVMRSETNYPLSVGISSLVGLYESRWDLVMTAALVSIVPIMILFFRMRNVFINGLGAMGTGAK